MSPSSVSLRSSPHSAGVACRYPGRQADSSIMSALAFSAAVRASPARPTRGQHLDQGFIDRPALKAADLGKHLRFRFGPLD